MLYVARNGVEPEDEDIRRTYHENPIAPPASYAYAMHVSSSYNPYSAAMPPSMPLNEHMFHDLGYNSMPSNSFMTSVPPESNDSRPGFGLPAAMHKDVLDYPRKYNTMILIENFFGQTIRTLEHMLLMNDPDLFNAISRLRTYQTPDVTSTWLLMALMLASLHPTADDVLERNGTGTLPGYRSIRRAMAMMVGPRGAVHGWSGQIPAIADEVQRQGTTNFVFPKRWAPDLDSDGDSSFRSDSPTQDVSGPRGVDPSQPPASGMTSDSDDPPEDEVQGGRMFVGGGPTDFNEKKLVERFDKFLTRSNRERRGRRTARRSRRMADLLSGTTQYLENPRAADQKRHERIIQFGDELNNEIRNIWFRYYGQQPIPVRNGMSEMKLVCWMTPVRWIAQKGPK